MADLLQRSKIRPSKKNTFASSSEDISCKQSVCVSALSVLHAPLICFECVSIESIINIISSET